MRAPPRVLHVDPRDQARHRAAYRRALALQAADTALLVALVAVVVALLLGYGPTWPASLLVLAACALLVRWAWGHPTRNPHVAEWDAARAAFTAHVARAEADQLAGRPDPDPDGEIYDRLCAAIDEAELAVPWWRRLAAN